MRKERSLRRPVSDRRPLYLRTAASAAVLLCLAACETLSEMNSSSPQKPSQPSPAASPTAAPTTAAKPAPPPRFNLTGYSTAFKQGYADACATPKRRNSERFRTDTDYSMGWQDGQSACRSR